MKKKQTAEEKLQAALVPKKEQPYELPEKWCWVRLGSINEFISKSVNPKSEINKIYELYSVPSYDNQYPEIIENKAIGSSKVEVAKEDVLLCKINPRINRVWKVYQYTDNPLLASGEWIVVRNKLINADYLVWGLRSNYFRQLMQENVSGVGGSLMRAKPKFVSTYPVPIAPLNEQKRIVVKLQSYMEKLDEAKEKVEQVLDTFETRKAAILHAAFTGKLTEQWSKEQHLTNSWKEYTLQEVCISKITDGTHQTPQYCSKEDGGMPFLSSKDITSENINWENIKYITPELHKELYKRVAPQKDDVLLAKNGTTGIAAIVEENKVFDIYVTLALLRPNKNIINPRYLLYILNSPVCRNQFHEHLTGIGVPNLHLRDIKVTKINVPSLLEQKLIVKKLDSLLKKEVESNELIDQVNIQIDTLKKAILARAFRGELGTGRPEDPSALDELKAYFSQEEQVAKSKEHSC